MILTVVCPDDFEMSRVLAASTWSNILCLLHFFALMIDENDKQHNSCQVRDDTKTKTNSQTSPITYTSHDHG